MKNFINMFFILMVILAISACTNQKTNMKKPVSTTGEGTIEIANCAADYSSNARTPYDYIRITSEQFYDRMIIPDPSDSSKNIAPPQLDDYRNFITNELCSFSYNPIGLNFEYTDRNNRSGIAKNILAIKEGQSDKILIIGAHFDSKGTGSNGISDNATGVATNLMLAKYWGQSKIKPYYTLHFMFFDAEENGLNGSKAIAKNIVADSVDQFVGMINLDTIAGGDIIYINSPKADNNYTDYSALNADVKIRDFLHLSVKALNLNHIVKAPAVEDYDLKEGEVGDYSDYVWFYRHGLPVAAVESTNFNLLARDGIYDGYSQVANLAFWRKSNTQENCAMYPSDAIIEGGPTGRENIANSYPRSCEEGWGEIWHRGFDTLDMLEKYFPGRLEKQLNDVLNVLIHATENLNNLK